MGGDGDIVSCWRGVLSPHLAHCGDPGLQTVCSVCGKMLDSSAREDEFKGKWKPEGQMRSGGQQGKMRALPGWVLVRVRMERGVLPVKVTWISRWGAYTQTYNILGLEKAEGFRAAL